MAKAILISALAAGLTAGLRITAKMPSYFSAGVQPAFTHEPREVPLTDLTEAQVTELRADPWLIVQDCEIKPPPDPNT